MALNSLKIIACYRYTYLLAWYTITLTRMTRFRQKMLTRKVNDADISFSIVIAIKLSLLHLLSFDLGSNLMTLAQVDLHLLMLNKLKLKPSCLTKSLA